MLVASAEQHHHWHFPLSAHSHNLLIPAHHRLSAQPHAAQWVCFQNVAARIVDDELWLAEVEVLADRVDESEVLLVGGFAVDVQSSGDGVFALGVLEDEAVVAVHNVDILVEDEVSLEAVALVGVQVDDHDFADPQP